jgi:hypothetical protein
MISMRFFKTALLDILLLLAWVPLLFGMVILLTHWQVQRSVRDANLLLAQWSQLEQLPLLRLEVESARLRWPSSPTQFWTSGWHSPILQLVGVRLQLGHLTLAHSARVDVAGLVLWQMPPQLTLKMSDLHLLPQWWWPGQTAAQHALIAKPAFSLDLQWFYAAEPQQHHQAAIRTSAEITSTHIALAEMTAPADGHALQVDTHGIAAMPQGRWQFSVQLNYQHAHDHEPVFQMGIEWQQMAALWQLLQQQQRLAAQLGWQQPSAAQWQSAWQQARWQRWQWQLQTPTTWPRFPQVVTLLDRADVRGTWCTPVILLLKTVQQQWTSSERNAAFARFDKQDLTDCY